MQYMPDLGWWPISGKNGKLNPLLKGIWLIQSDLFSFPIADFKMAIITELSETPAFTLSIEDLKQGSAYLCNNIKDAVFIGYNGPGVGSNIRAVSICGKYAVGTNCGRYKFREVNLRVIVE